MCRNGGGRRLPPNKRLRLTTGPAATIDGIPEKVYDFLVMEPALGIEPRTC
jgi:hypothetical protein